MTTNIVTGKLDVREAAAKLPDPPATFGAELSVDTLDEADAFEETKPEES